MIPLVGGKQVEGDLSKKSLILATTSYNKASISVVANHRLTHSIISICCLINTELAYLGPNT